MANDMVLRPSNFGELTTFAQMAARSGMVPAAYANKPEAIMLAVQMGSELGLAPMQSLQNISVINGRPSVWGDAMLGLCKNSPHYAGIEESVTGSGDAMEAVCIVHRKGDKPVVGKFSAAQAKKAGLWTKSGPWVTYPDRMLKMRARGFALRDAFPDVLRGLISAEEAQDIPTTDTFAGTTVEVKPEPAEQTFIERVTAALEGEANQTKWFKFALAALERCQSINDLTTIRGLTSFKSAMAKLPSMLAADLKAALVAATDRLSPQADPEPDLSPDVSDAVEQMFDHLPPKADNEDIFEDIKAQVSEITTEEGMKAWASDTAIKAIMGALRRESPDIFARAIAMIDERRLQIEG